MKLRSKIVYILFYLFAVLILFMTEDLKGQHLKNLWNETKILLRKKHSPEDGDYILLHKDDKK